MNEESKKRLKILVDRCVESHSTDDIIEHLEEELIELLLAIKRVRRGKEPIENFVEELIDAHIETITVMTLLDEKEELQKMLDRKLTKFQSMLDSEKNQHPLETFNRYDTIPMKRDMPHL